MLRSRDYSRENSMPMTDAQRQAKRRAKAASTHGRTQRQYFLTDDEHLELLGCLDKIRKRAARRKKILDVTSHADG